MNKKKKNIKQFHGEEQSFKWIYIFLFVFAIGLYLNTLNHDFAFDDSVVITGNKFTKQGTKGIYELVTNDLFAGIYGRALDLEGGRYRPLTLVMFAVEYQLFGDNASPYHFINILLYGITAIILFLTLLEIFSISPDVGGRGGRGEGRMLAFITTLLFIAHPIHTEVVANIKSRDEIVSFIFLCLTLLFLFRAVRKNIFTFKKLGLAMLCYLLSLLSKENGITFLAIIPLALFCFGGKNVKQSLLLTVPFLSVAAVYLIFRTSIVGIIGDRVSNDVTDNPFLYATFSEKLATISWILGKYLLLLIYPHPLSCDYGYNQIAVIGWTNPKAFLPLIIYILFFLFAVKTIWNWKKISTSSELNDKRQTINYKLIFAFCILFYLITISIVSNVFFLIGTSMGERFIFLSSLGFCLALSVLFIRLLRITNSSDDGLRINAILSPKILIPLLVILFSYSAKTISRNSVWKNNATLFKTDVNICPGSANLHYYFANTMFTDHINDDQSFKRDSLFTEAKKEFIKAMNINPLFHYCYYNIGLIYEKLNQPDSAITWLLKTINLKPENTLAQAMAKGELGLVYGKQKGEIDKAIPLLKESIAYRPDDFGSYENLGICYAMKGDYDNSINAFEQSLKLKPELSKSDARLLLNLALSWQNKGNKQKADYYYNESFKLDPSLKK
ncbi:MAG: tetratricopeptide repeat protein [Bacteroidota bacterium]